jgi:hypothetical protein
VSIILYHADISLWSIVVLIAIAGMSEPAVCLMICDVAPYGIKQIIPSQVRKNESRERNKTITSSKDQMSATLIYRSSLCTSNGLQRIFLNRVK